MTVDRRDPATRSDALRNHGHLLAVARETFSERGTDASLREVARRAEVGIGTLYRHFPTREVLLEELLSDGFDTLRVRADELAESPDPYDGLVTWLRELAAGLTAYDGLPESVMAALHDADSRLRKSCEGLRTAAGDLLARAQRGGRIRPDLDTAELLTAVYAMAWASRRSAADADSTERYLALLLEGLAR
jgi:AcrR family transcriptional regulator